MKFENFAVSPENNEDVEKFDPHLEQLWGEYDFPGNPPRKGTAAEKRLRNTCEQYVVYLDSKNYTGRSLNLKKEFDSTRRRLHNEIAIMVVGKQRSGMDLSDAQHIANFAFEYIKGYRMDEAEKFENN